MVDTTDRVALVVRGAPVAGDPTVLTNSRLAPVASALRQAGLAPEAALYDDNRADDVREQLLGVGGVLVWVDPVTEAGDRTRLDAILREVADAGVWVSAHPDVIMKMGTKEVLFRTRDLGWGSDTRLYRTREQFAGEFPAALLAGPRVIKQYRGNGGIGVWKVELGSGQGDLPSPETVVLVQSARRRDDVVEAIQLGEFMTRCEKYFSYSDGEGRLIDQPFQPRITEGIVRCYLVA